MKINRRSGIALALGVVVTLIWPLKEAASWRPKKFCEMRGATTPHISADGHFMFIPKAGMMGQGQLWEIEAARLVREVPPGGVFPYGKANFSPDSRQLWLFESVSSPSSTNEPNKGFSIHTLRAMDIQSGQVTLFHDRNVRLGDTLDSNASWGLARGEREMWMASRGTLRRFDARSGRLLEALELGGGRSPAPVRSSSVLPGDRVFVLEGDTAFVDEVGRDGKLKRRLARAGERDLNFGDGRRVGTYAVNSAGATAVERLSDGKTLWRIPAGETFRTFSPDDREAYVSDEQGLSVREASTGREVRRLPGPKENFAPSPDGKWLFEARDGAVWKWRAR